jgi:transcriptional regulator with XRE-family HTH domain
VQSDVRRRIGENIQAHARRRGLSLLALSRAANVGSAQVYRVVRGAAWASDEWLARVAKALGVDVATLLDRTGEHVDNQHDTRRMTMHQVDEGKPASFQVALTGADKARLDALAESYAISQGAVIRLLLKRDADARAIVVRAKPTKKTKR